MRNYKEKKSSTIREKTSLIVIAGPTGVGKTATAIALAEPLGGEIIGADAMQVYRQMDVGTAKPTEQERTCVKHHLVDVVDPDEPFTAATFRTRAKAVVNQLHEKGVPIFVVGGTGLYIKALTHGLFHTKEGDEAVRKRLKADAETLGLEVLHKRLQRVDPTGAARIHPNDSYRIIRALEVFESTGRSLSEHHRAHSFSDSPYEVLKMGLFVDREILYDRINKRVEQMLASGLLEEVKGLLDRGFGPRLKSMRSIGYRHMTDFLQGEVTWDETMRLFKRDTRRYAKRQLTWFRAVPDIEWFQPSEIDIMRDKIDSFLEKKSTRAKAPRR
jgi:tRNA dimethylallyltransferase